MGMTATAQSAREWMETATGKKFCPFDAAPSYRIEDIIWGLARECRFAGQLRPSVEFYSVAEHLTIMTRHLQRVGGYSERELRTAAMHDASEGLLGDMVRPIKRMNPEFRAMEEAFEAKLAERYSLIYPLPDWLKELDSRMLKDERAAVMPESGNVWFIDGLEPLGVEIQAWRPNRAAAEYWAVLREVGAMRFEPE